MKIKSIFATLLISSGAAVTAQTVHPVLNTNTNTDITIPSKGEFLGSKLVLNGDIEETIIGNTKYDLQTNTAIQPRLVVHENGSMSAAWTFSSPSSSGFADRGTGYNFFDGSNWGDAPTERLESIRTGWPSLIALPGGGEAFMAHTLDQGSRFAKRDVAGTGAWTFSTVEEGTNELNNVWHRMAVGGASNNTLHVIGAENTHTHPDSSTYYMRYSRSTDLGATWDVVNSQITGIQDSVSADPWSGDAYNITSSGDKVAFVVGSGSRDVVLLESTDNGTTWSSNIIVDFPEYDIMSDLIDTNTVMNEQGAYFGSDGSYQIFYDENDELQVYFGGYYLANTDTTDEFIQLPYSFEIFRWKKSYGFVADGTASKDGTVLGYNQLDTVMTIPDFNGDGQISVANGTDGGFADYGRLSKVTHPSITTAANGDLYMTFSSVIDSVNTLQFDVGAPYLKNHTHQMISKSTDNGDTWSAPKDMLSLFAIDNQLAEGVFGNVVTVDSKVYIMYQRDETPGLHVSGEEHAAENNRIVVASFDMADLDILTLTEDQENVFQISPNPSFGETTVTLTEGFESSKIEVMNTLGQVVYTTTANGNQVVINTTNFTSGLYILNVMEGSKIYSKKLMVK